MEATEYAILFDWVFQIVIYVALIPCHITMSTTNVDSALTVIPHRLEDILAECSMLALLCYAIPYAYFLRPVPHCHLGDNGGDDQERSRLRSPARNLSKHIRCLIDCVISHYIFPNNMNPWFEGTCDHTTSTERVLLLSPWWQQARPAFGVVPCVSSVHMHTGP